MLLTKGIVALITGAASGLGKATAERLLQLGGRVVVVDLPSSKGQSVADQLGENCIFVPADVSKEEDVQNALKCTSEKFSRLDIVVNCAGISRASKVLNQKEESYHYKNFIDQLMVNCCGTFNVIRLAARMMCQNSPDPSNGQRGLIVNTASSAAFDGCSGQTGYAATQGAIVSMTLPIARDLSSYGIRCVTLAPGYFDTVLVKGIHERVIQMFTDATPFPNRLGDPDEFAACVQNIIENPMLNGTTIRIDGGLRLSF